MSRPVRLNRALTLEDPQRVPDGAGGFNETWVALGTLWADLRPGTGRDRGAEFATLATVPYRITVRASAEGAPSRPRPGQRFREGGRVFAIAAVTEADAIGRYLVCFASEEISA